jgi:hypothetical protein
LLEALINLLPALGRLLSDRSRKRGLSDERGQRAVECILRAVNETKIYVAFLARGKARDETREEALSRHWTDTAAAMRGIDDDLAQRCRLKGHYWADPDHWSAKRLEEARIGLTQVALDADAVLGWSQPGAENPG